MSALDRATAALGNANVKALLRVIREGETAQTDDAYQMAFGGGLHAPNVHPWLGQTTTEVGHSTAFGAYQFLGSSAKEALDALGLGEDFSPVNQDLCAVWTIDAKRHALAEVVAGDLPGAITKLGAEWVSLPGLPLDRARRVFTQYGGTQAPTAPDASTHAEPTATPPGGHMDPLTLIAIFGPILQQLIPQVGKLFGGAKDAKNAQIIGTVLDTVVKATGQAGPADVATVGAAVQAMQADKAVQKATQEAVVTQPEIMAALQIMEVAGGAKAAREQDLQVMASELPFWKSSAVFWISVLLLPIVYWLVGSLIVGGIAIPEDWPAWAQLPLKMFGVAWNGESRSGGFNLVIGLILGGICGVYYGVSVTQSKQQQSASSIERGTGTGTGG